MDIIIITLLLYMHHVARLAQVITGLAVLAVLAVLLPQLLLEQQENVAEQAVAVLLLL
jgi:hypothetical protein